MLFLVLFVVVVVVVVFLKYYINNKRERERERERYDGAQIGKPHQGAWRVSGSIYSFFFITKLGCITTIKQKKINKIKGGEGFQPRSSAI